MIRGVCTHIRMSSDLFDDRVIKVTRVTQKVTGDIVCVLETLEDIRGNRELSSLSELGSLSLAGRVDVLHPAVMLTGRGLGDVLLEHNDVGVWDLYRVG